MTGIGFGKDEMPEQWNRKGRRTTLPCCNDVPKIVKSNRSMWQNLKRKASELFPFPAVKSKKLERKPGESIQALSAKAHGVKSSRSCAANFAPDQEEKIVPRRRVFSSVCDETVLHFAVAEDHIDIVKGILSSKNGIDINYTRPPGISPLHQACIVGNLDCVQLLVQHGANIYLRDWRGQSPLKLATCYGHFEVAEYLLKMGSPVQDIKDGFQSAGRRKRARTHPL